MINGKVVGLRAIEKEDLNLLKDWRNNPSLRKNFREYRELNFENQINWFANLQTTGNTNFMFIIEDLKNMRPIGAAGLLYTNWITRSADFSLYIGSEALYIDNMGFAKEAASLLIQYGFNELNLNKIWMEVYEFDDKKLEFFQGGFGFKIDGKLRENCFTDGRFWDSYIISLTRKDLYK